MCEGEKEICVFMMCVVSCERPKRNALPGLLQDGS